MVALYPRFVVEDGRILCKVNVDGVERACPVSEGLALSLIADLAKAIQWADCSAPHPSDSDQPKAPAR